MTLNMGNWIHQWFVWVTLISIHPSCAYNNYINYLNYHEHNHGHQIKFVQNRKSYYSRTNMRSIDRYVDSGVSVKQPQHNELSILYNLNTQRVYDQSGRNPEVTRNVRANNNSSFEVVNDASKPYSGFNNFLQIIRRDVLAQQAYNLLSLKGSAVFPEPTSRTSSFVPQITDKECLKTGICEHIPNYPENRVVEILKEVIPKSHSWKRIGFKTTKDLDMLELEGTKYRFNNDRLDTQEYFSRTATLEKKLCNSDIMVVYPTAIRDNNDHQWYIVLNQQKKPQQGFRIEVCHPENVPCSAIIYVDQDRYNTSCIQKYQYRVISVINSQGDLMEKEFALPSCCSCVLNVL